MAATRTLRSYKRNFLDKVIVRADFAHSVAIPDAGPAKEILAVLKKTFPIQEFKKSKIRAINIAEHGVGQSTVQEIPEWWYWNKARNKHVTINADVLLIDYSKYHSFKGLKRDFTPILNALTEHEPDLRIKRLGLRYIDALEFDDTPSPTDWTKYIDPSLLHITQLADNEKAISRVLQWLELNYGDMCLRFQYGMPNPDYPAAIKRRRFILDTDAYTDYILEPVQVSDWMDKFHTAIYDLFERVITDKLRYKMGRQQ